MEQEYLLLFKKLGENIKNTREEKQIALDVVAHKTGIRKQYLKKIENGEAYGFTTTQFMKIAVVLKVKPRELVKNI